MIEKYYDSNIYVKLNSEVKTRMNKYCTENNLKIQDFVDDSLRKYLGEKGIVFDVLKHRMREVVVD
jgi:antitoxin component of RelBE/YafQ-DinJ toxin-antitoxin module